MGKSCQGRQRKNRVILAPDSEPEISRAQRLHTTRLDYPQTSLDVTPIAGVRARRVVWSKKASALISGKKSVSIAAALIVVRYHPKDLLNLRRRLRSGHTETSRHNGAPSPSLPRKTLRPIVAQESAGAFVTFYDSTLQPKTTAASVASGFLTLRGGNCRAYERGV